MAYRPSILLSKEAAEKIKQRYAARGEATTANALAKGSSVYVAKTKEGSDLIGASVDSRANAWNQLTVKAALSQGEEDVKISLGMLGSPEQYKAAIARQAAIAADISAIQAARSAAGTARWGAKKARSERDSFDALTATEERQWQSQLAEKQLVQKAARQHARDSEEHWAAASREADERMGIRPKAVPGRFNDADRRGRALLMDWGVIESERRNREFVDQPLEAPSAWDSFVSDVTQMSRMGRAWGAPLNLPLLLPTPKFQKLWKEGL